MIEALPVIRNYLCSGAMFWFTSSYVKSLYFGISVVIVVFWLSDNILGLTMTMFWWNNA